MATTPPGGPELDPQDKSKITRNLKESVEIQQELAENADLFKDINAQINATGKEVDNIKSLSTQLNNVFKETLTMQSRIGREFIKISDIQSDINKLAAAEAHIKKQTNVSIASAISKNKQVRQDALAVLQNNKDLVKLNKQIDALAANTNRTAAENALYQKLQLDALNKEIDSETKLKKAGVNNVVYLKQQLKHAQESRKNLEQSIPIQEKMNKLIDDATQEELKKADALNEKMGSLYRIMRELSKIPLVGEFINTRKIMEEMEKTAKATDNRWKTFGAGLSATFSEIFKVMSNPITTGLILAGVLKELVSQVLKFEKSITETANILALSKETTQSIYKHYENISINSKKESENVDAAFLSITNQAKALDDLNNAFGTSVMFTDQQVQGQIMLQKQMGLNADEAKGIQNLALLNKSTVDSTLKTIIKQNDSAISYKKIIADVSKINGQLVAQYRNSPELLAKAVVQAEKLGVTLEGAKKQSDFLLDFQSSISSELESELLLGRSISLEKARQLALDGKSAEAAKEMMEQVGGFQYYSRLNVIQQKSLAQTIGLSASELSDALRTQETLNKLGVQSTEELMKQRDLITDQSERSKFDAAIKSKAGGEQILQQITQASIQAKFEQSMQKVKEIFVSIASGPMIGMLNGIAKFLENANNLKGVLIGISAVIGGIAAAWITALAVANPVAALAGLAIGAIGAAAVMNYTKMQDGVIAPDGQIVISTPRGTVVPDRSDGVVLTPNYGVNSDKGGGNDKELLSVMTDIREMMKKGNHVYLDSNKVGLQQGISYSGYA